LGVPVVYQPHCFKFDDPSLSRIKALVFRAAERLLGRFTKVVLALSVHEANLVREINPSVQCVMLPNAPTIPLALAPKRLTPDTVKRVVMVGRLSPQKDPTLFGNLAKAIRKSHADAELVWIGDGDPELRSYLESKGVRVTGWLPSSGLMELLDSSACYVHTALYEGFPLSVLDAAARGLPIVARAIPAFEGSGLLQGSDAQQLADHVSRILGDTRHYERATQLNAHLLKEMCEDKQKQALESAYKIAIGGKP
jgi:glycosyltransferase involved in cell wall biosynthesis